MSHDRAWFVALLTFLLGLVLVLNPGFEAPAQGQVLKHPFPELYAVYPAGGQAGQSLEIELLGRGGFEGAAEVLVEGPGGVTISDVQVKSGSQATARVTIAPDAPPGRRELRLLGGAGGMTNFRPFFVSNLPEIVESEPNNTPEAPQAVELPVVVNGRFQKVLDVDCFRFRAAAGQNLAAGVAAYQMDGFLDAPHNGFLDTSLELLDSQGTVLASAEDTLGLDPLIEFRIPRDGDYCLRIWAREYAGAPLSAYRLLIGELPVATAVFPPGGAAGEELDVELFGPNVPEGTRVRVPPESDGFPLQYVSHPATAGVFEARLFRQEAAGDRYVEIIESEPNDEAGQASPISAPCIVSGRFDRPGDADWFRISAIQGERLQLEVLSQRQLRSPVDSLLQIYDAAGALLAENDDGAAFGLGVRAAHDFPSHDSWLAFTAPADGDYFVRVGDNNGSSGPRSCYRLIVRPMQPEIRAMVWPDAVPIWGPGTTSAFVVEVKAWAGASEDVQIEVVDLPEGWTGSRSNWPAGYYRAYNERYTIKHLLTITAPADAPLGATAPFRVLVRTKIPGEKGERGESGEPRELVREAEYYTLLGNSHSDGMLLRRSRGARAVVARPLDSRLRSPIDEVVVQQGETARIPIHVDYLSPEGESRPTAPIGLVVNGPAVHVGVGWQPPKALAPGQQEATVEFPTDNILPGTYGIVVARSWASDLRTGRPGPCTPVIWLRVSPK